MFSFNYMTTMRFNDVVKLTKLVIYINKPIQTVTLLKIISDIVKC